MFQLSVLSGSAPQPYQMFKKVDSYWLEYIDSKSKELKDDVVLVRDKMHHLDEFLKLGEDNERFFKTFPDVASVEEFRRKYFDFSN